MTPQKMQAMQLDPGSERANLYVPLFLAAAERRANDPTTLNHSQLATAAKILGAWDRRYTRENRAAALFEEAMRALPAAVWDELSVDGRRVATPPSGVLLQLMSDSASTWWDDRNSERIEHRDDILAGVL